MRQWKLSADGPASRVTRWEDYSRAKDEMFVHTDIAEAPWYVVESDDKRHARLNMIAHLLSHARPTQRVRSTADRPAAPAAVAAATSGRRASCSTYVPDHVATLLERSRPDGKHAEPRKAATARARKSHRG